MDFALVCIKYRSDEQYFRKKSAQSLQYDLRHWISRRTSLYSSIVAGNLCTRSILHYSLWSASNCHVPKWSLYLQIPDALTQFPLYKPLMIFVLIQGELHVNRKVPILLADRKRNRNEHHYHYLLRLSWMNSPSAISWQIYRFTEIPTSPYKDKCNYISVKRP